jgi:hypothetical protein
MSERALNPLVRDEDAVRAAAFLVWMKAEFWAYRPISWFVAVDGWSEPSKRLLDLFRHEGVVAKGFADCPQALNSLDLLTEWVAYCCAKPPRWIDDDLCEVEAEYIHNLILGQSRNRESWMVRRIEGRWVALCPA